MPFKRIKRAFKKVTKPVAKVLDKVVPNEIKPFLPYASAVAPFLLPPGFGTGFASGIFKTTAGQQMAARALAAGAANLGSQLAQEGNEEGDFSALSLGLAGLQGALTAPGAAETLQGMTTAGSPEYLQLGEQATLADAAGNIDAASAALGDQAKMLADRGLLTKAADFGLGSLSKGAEAIDTIMTAGAQDPFSMAGLKAASIPFTQGSVDLGMATARKALQDYEAELAAFNAQADADREASDADRRAAIIASMTRANFTQDIIDETLGQLGLKDGGIARLGFGNGGKTGDLIMDKLMFLPNTLDKVAEKVAPMLGYDLNEDKEPNFGGIKEAIKGVAENNMEEGVTQMYVSDSAGVIPLKDGDAVTGKTMDMMVSGFIEPYTKNDFRDPDGYERFMDIFSEFKETKMKRDKELNEEGMKKGGLASLKDGGIMDLGGKEMDMRGGGFIPIGAKERADDVPARLSKNEFVMTADAVRAAGGGSVNKGAKRMYDLMHNLEARA